MHDSTSCFNLHTISVGSLLVLCLIFLCKIYSTDAPTLCSPSPRVVDYEARASAALQQALSEEDRLAKLREATAAEVEATNTARQLLQVRGGGGARVAGHASTPVVLIL
jgi:hypothetical protein